MATTKITSPELFDLGSLNTALKLPSGTTAQRPTSPSTGEWRYNTTTNLVEFYDGAEWLDLQSEDIPPINSENFNTVLWSGDDTDGREITVGFKPDFVWIKPRNLASAHRLFDSTRGATKFIMSDSNSAEQTASSVLQSFTSTGFTVGISSGVNESPYTYVAWCWKAGGGTTSSNTDGTITSTVQANTKAEFSVVSYTGTGANATIGHGLSSAPEIMIIKELTSTRDWAVYSKYNTGGSGNPAEERLKLNTNDATVTYAPYWNSIEPTSTVFNVGVEGNVNTSGQSYIAYVFAPVAGYSKIGSYTGNGSATGPIENTGLEPAFLMIKRTDSSSDWLIYDNKRSTSNPRDDIFRANTNQAELTSAVVNLDFLSNGFQLKTSTADLNANGGTYIYIAFGSDASAAPALADSFGIGGYVGNASTKIVNNSGFSPSLVWMKDRSSSGNHYWQDTIRGLTSQISSNLTAAETTYTSNITSFNDNGFTLGTATDTNAENHAFVGWQWKGNTNPTINTDGTIQSVVSANQAAGFSIVQYTGTGSAGPSIGHGLSSAPTYIIAKTLDTVAKWRVFQSSLGGTKYLNFSDTDAAGTSSNIWNDFTPTATVFQVGSDLSPSSRVIAYCFNDVAGFSKFGSYTGTGATGNTVAVGFQPDFVMVKASSTTEPWFLLDSVRNPINPRDNRLMADSTAAEDTGSVHTIDFNATSFILNGTVGNGTNGSGQTYIYMAYKMNPSALSIPTGEMAFLNVAGGGGGGGKTTSGNTRGGGGGGGGLKTSYGTLSGGGASAESNITLAAGTYTITVGAGGGKSTGSGTGISGGDSSVAGPSLTTITSAGGGGGGDFQVQGAAGGSGGGYGGAGGTGTTTCAGGAGTASQGFNGGGVNGGSGVDAGGGGGAGECGGFGVFRQAYGGVGGSGLMVTITSNGKYYAGGGGGGSDSNGLDPRLGGVGGGGYGASGPSGGVGNVSQPGVVNTGGGGGGEGSNGTPGDGGSGIVVIRLNTSDYSGTTTGSPTITTDGDYTVLEYTGSGTYVHS